MTRDDLRRQIAEYEMPRVAVGTPVLWYRTGRANCDPMIAYMLHCGGRTCQLFLADGRRQDSVRHIGDPKLNLSGEQRESGAWEFTHGEKELAVFKEQMEKRVAALEKQVEDRKAAMQDNKPNPKETTKQGRGGPDAFREYRELRQQAIDMGIDATNMKKHELKRAIARAEGRMVQSTVAPIPDQPVSSPYNNE